MKDRIVEAPDRFAIEWLDKDNGLCRIIKKPGAVAQQGSLYCVENVLPGDVCANLGLDQNTAEPKDAFKALTTLAASALVGFPSELEDYTMEIGSFNNTAAGWCTRRFQTVFDTVPQVILMPQNFDGYVQINNVSTSSFQYCLRQKNAGSVYVALGVGSQCNHEIKEVITGFDTVVSAIKIGYIAIDYGGE